jgi:hypothetical protein
MFNISKFEKMLTISFFLIYVLVGIYVIWLNRNLIMPTFSNLLICTYFMFPLIIICIGILAFLRGKSPNVYLWLSSIYWFLYTFSEVVEGGRISPSITFVVFMLVVSSLCMIFLSLRSSTKTG